MVLLIILEPSVDDPPGIEYFMPSPVFSAMTLLIKMKARVLYASIPWPRFPLMTLPVMVGFDPHMDMPLLLLLRTFPSIRGVAPP